MKNVERIIQDMRKHVPLKKIKQKYKSRSQLYEAYRRYLPEAEKRIKEEHDKLHSLSSNQRTLKQKVESLSVEINRLNKEIHEKKQSQKTLIEKTENGYIFIGDYTDLLAFKSKGYFSTYDWLD